MSTQTQPAPAHLQALVSAEVERQLASVKDEVAKAIADVRCNPGISQRRHG